MKHKHADLMAQYAEDALKTDKPWELWEQSCDGKMWATYNNHPAWASNWEYRRVDPSSDYIIEPKEELKPLKKFVFWGDDIPDPPEKVFYTDESEILHEYRLQLWDACGR